MENKVLPTWWNSPQSDGWGLRCWAQTASSAACWPSFWRSPARSRQSARRTCTVDRPLFPMGLKNNNKKLKLFNTFHFFDDYSKENKLISREKESFFYSSKRRRKIREEKTVKSSWSFGKIFLFFLSKGKKRKQTAKKTQSNTNDEERRESLKNGFWFLTLVKFCLSHTHTQHTWNGFVLVRVHSNRAGVLCLIRKRKWKFWKLKNSLVGRGASGAFHWKRFLQ